jgi:very-short-patch-repair endonuclease
MMVKMNNLEFETWIKKKTGIHVPFGKPTRCHKCGKIIFWDDNRGTGLICWPDFSPHQCNDRTSIDWELVLATEFIDGFNKAPVSCPVLRFLKTGNVQGIDDFPDCCVNCDHYFNDDKGCMLCGVEYIDYGYPEEFKGNTVFLFNLMKMVRNQKKTESPIEEQLLQEMKKQGLEPKIQHEAGPYRLDFAFPEKKIGIECDGQEFHSTKEQRTHDANRDRYFMKEGWKVIRFTGSEIYNHAWQCVQDIKKIAGF